jgi:hypothetical protein
MTTEVIHDDTGKETDIPFHCGNECPVEGEKDYSDDNEHDVYPCGYRHWCPWCGDCEYCYDRGPHEWD